MKKIFFFFFTISLKTDFLSDIFTQSSILILTSLAFKIALDGTIFNIAIQSQMIICGFFFCLFCLKSFSIFFSIILSIFITCLFSLFIVILKRKLDIHEVVTAIMFNYIFSISEIILIEQFLSNGTYSRSAKILDTQNSFDFLLYLTALFAIFSYYYISKTNLGLKFKIMSHNLRLAENFGINVENSMLISMLISGIFAGFAGYTKILINNCRYSSNIMSNYGFDAILTVYMGKNLLGVVFFCFLLSFLRMFLLNMELDFGMPADISFFFEGIALIYFGRNYD